MKTIQTSSLLIMALLVLLVSSCKEDETPAPVVPDYTTYYFEDFLTVDSVELTASNGYSYAVMLKRTATTQADAITVELADASGVFAFDDGNITKTLNFAAGESSKTIDVMPLDVMNVSAFATYPMTTVMEVPAGTASQGEFSKSVLGVPEADYQAIAAGNIAYGWAFATAVYGVTTKDINLEKDGNVALYKCLAVYSDDYDIYFGVDNGNVVIENLQIMMITDPALFGAAVEMAMEVTATAYDEAANTVTLTYDMVRTDGGTFAGVPMTDVVDVYTLP